MAGFNYTGSSPFDRIEASASRIEITGSLNIELFGATGSLLGTSTGNLTSASFTDGTLELYYGDQITSSSINFTSGTFQATASNALTASYYLETQTLQSVTSLEGSSSSSINLTGPVTASNLQATGSFMGTSETTGSLFGTASWAKNANTASYVLPLQQNVEITGSIQITGSNVFTFQTLPEVFETSSTMLYVVYDTSSGQFYSLNSDPVFNFSGFNGPLIGQTLVNSLTSTDLVVVGRYTAYGTDPVGRIAALNIDGTLDNTSEFSTNIGTGFSANPGTIYKANTNDGYLIGPGYTGGTGTATFNGSPTPSPGGPWKLKPDGTWDTTFNFGGSGLSDGKRIIYYINTNPAGGYIFNHDGAAGSTGAYNGTSVGTIIAINEDGTLNTTLQTQFNSRYSSGYFTHNTVTRVTPDGKILAWDNNPNNTAWNNGRRIALLNADGTINTAFDTGIGTGPNANLFCSIQQTGSADTDYRFIITGYNGSGTAANLTTWNGTAVQDIFAVKQDGTIDSTFSQMNYTLYAGAAAGNVVRFNVINNKLYAFGQFSQIAGQTANGVARFDMDGNFDASFNPGGTGATIVVGGYMDILVESETRNELILAGAFTAWNGEATLTTGTSCVMRMSYDGVKL